MKQPPPLPPKRRHSFGPLLVAPPARQALPDDGPPSSGTRKSRAANESHVRLRALGAPPAAGIDFLDAQDLLDELGEDHLMMSMNLTCLEEAVLAAPRDASARAALRTLTARLADLAMVRDALGAVQQASADPRLQRLLLPDAPLADYLRGMYSWAHAITRALDELAASLRTLTPDWALLRWRIDEAKNFHFDELFEAIRADLKALAIVAGAGSFGADGPQVGLFVAAVENLFVAATTLEDRLDQRFG